MRRSKINLGPKTKKKRGIPLKFIVIPVAILLAITFIAAYTWNALKNWDYFKTQDVVCKGVEGIDLSYLKGKNILAINLKKESAYIQGFHPDYQAVKLARVFPDRIFVYFVKRQPAALIKLYKYFILDKNGFLYNAPDDIRSLELPLVTGLENKISSPSAGRRYNIKETALTLNILREFEKFRAFKNYRIKKIDVRQAADASLVLVFPAEAADYSKGAKDGVAAEGLEIKLGGGNIRQKFAILAGILARGKLDLLNIKYIDLRFDKPVVKYGNAK